MDISTNPTVFEVDAPEGDYPCIILEFAREITFASPVTEGLCTAGEEYTIDTCNHSQTAEDPTTGTIWNCSDTSITKMFIYISTGSNNPGTQQDDSTDVFLPPTFEGDPLHGVNLNGSININQDITGTFIIDFSHRLNTNNPERCDVSAPAFSFVK